jgi:hypothetical protein
MGFREYVPGDLFRILVDVTIPKPHDAVTLGLQQARASLIVRTVLVFTVLRTIYFNDEFCPMADEIQNVLPEWSLPAEVDAAMFAVSQSTPQQVFGICCGRSQ